ncbi:hypothetical protein [Flavobacterium sp. RSSB_23]|uniref:hypothetical protein n=1 Tax=Flavobacterium sp. RSSB_23 TaxID=3447668 RepID=UPI003F2AFC85
MKKIIFIHVGIPIIIGGLIYISFRSPSLRMFEWFKLCNIDYFTSLIRCTIYPLRSSYIPPWFYYSLPDGLWVYSFSSALLIFWNNDFGKVKYWLLIPIISGVLIEFLQGFKVFTGTFDLLDLVFSISGLLLSIFFINNKFKHYDNQAS